MNVKENIKEKVEIGNVYRYKGRESSVIFSVHMIIHIEDNLIYFADGKRVTRSAMETDEWEFIRKVELV